MISDYAWDDKKIGMLFVLYAWDDKKIGRAYAFCVILILSYTYRPT